MVLRGVAWFACWCCVVLCSGRIYDGVFCYYAVRCHAYHGSDVLQLCRVQGVVAVSHAQELRKDAEMRGMRIRLLCRVRTLCSLLFAG